MGIINLSKRNFQTNQKRQINTNLTFNQHPDDTKLISQDD